VEWLLLDSSLPRSYRAQCSLHKGTVVSRPMMYPKRAQGASHLDGYYLIVENIVRLDSCRRYKPLHTGILQLLNLAVISLSVINPLLKGCQTCSVLVYACETLLHVTLISRFSERHKRKITTRARHQVHAGLRADSEQDTTNNIYSPQKKLRVKLSRARQPMPCESTHESRLVPSVSDWHTANSLQSP